ncbi:hypothetical protein ACOAOT_23685 [Lacrimispora sp. AGF001]|uniref:hypothetical protein n=1 Tax=Lacrimispora sp. AGF001 TaxID=3401631 RepID=UPI003B439B74
MRGSNAEIKQEIGTMIDLEEKKVQEINTMVSVLKQLDLTGIQILSMNASTLLALKMELERQQDTKERRLA